MIYSAIVAIHPDVEQEFTDENAMAEMSLDLQQAVRGRNRAGLRGYVQGATTFATYLVWGTAEALEEAQLRWGSNMIIGDTWTKGDHHTPACRAGFRYEMQETVDSTPEDPKFERIRTGAEIRPRHPGVMNWLDDIPDQIDADGNIISWKRPADFTHLPIILGHGVRE